MSKQTKQTKKHVKTEEVVVRASSLEAPFTVQSVIDQGVPRCAVQRAIDNEFISVRKNGQKTGKRGRPAQLLSLSKKGKSLAAKASKVEEPVAA